MMIFRTVVAVIVAVMATTIASADSLSGTCYHNYRDNDNIQVQVSALTSVSTATPILYYSLPTCYPKKAIRSSPETLSEFILRDRKLLSPYEDLVTGEDIDCHVSVQRGECSR
ncbi:unnamed protein product [Bodo saltans]|uniref:Transmembrane 9 superfamily member n=1 Tax=Bodo saltans TaxID=75058 RepID=A0A0S4KK66_BODSA|nr:unnamed protein product [Bodo saltans]|eukprot:CUI14980.1 unnamed protein product [Bodo saltans]